MMCGVGLRRRLSSDKINARMCMFKTLVHSQMVPSAAKGNAHNLIDCYRPSAVIALASDECWKHVQLGTAIRGQSMLGRPHTPSHDAKRSATGQQHSTFNPNSIQLHTQPIASKRSRAAPRTIWSTRRSVTTFLSKPRAVARKTRNVCVSLEESWWCVHKRGTMEPCCRA